MQHYRTVILYVLAKHPYSSKTKTSLTDEGSPCLYNIRSTWAGWPPSQTDSFMILEKKSQFGSQNITWFFRERVLLLMRGRCGFSPSDRMPPLTTCSTPGRCHNWGSGHPHSNCLSLAWGRFCSKRSALPNGVSPLVRLEVVWGRRASHEQRCPNQRTGRQCRQSKLPELNEAGLLLNTLTI